jgi:exopolysaccharide biosynthesis polyprenyl glycosylphosphotransferase
MNTDRDVKKTVEMRRLKSNATSSYLVAKRLLDIAFSTIILFLILPVLLLIAVSIKVDSRGPVFFSQKRCGVNGALFKMYKFRSMVINAEQLLHALESRNDVKGCMFKMKKDPRVTRMGRFLRKTSLDELPQFLNVLWGDMSIVGPRPPIPSEVNEYGMWHNLRLSVKPGITGLWQVSARNKVSFEEMVALDLKYIRERNFLYDLKIIIRTIPLMLGDKRSY